MLGSGRKVILRAGFAPALARALQGSFAACAAGEFLLPGVAFAPDFQLQPLGESVDAGNADTVQSAGDFVAFGIELAAGVQLGHHDFSRRDALLFVHVHGNAAAVIDDRHGIIDVNGDVDWCAIPRQRFIHGVVHHFVDEVMQSHSPVEPMYMAGRRRTASRPSRTLMLVES